jgi:hypothetical protein
MAAKDVIHDAVKNALIKDGWTITADPFTIRYEDATVFADLAAERAIAAEKAGQKIIVEIKSFVGASAMQEFKLALGQYQTYLPFLKELGLEHKLYLAVSDVVYDQFFQRPSIQVLVKWHVLPILVVNTNTEEIVEWTN